MKIKKFSCIQCGAPKINPYKLPYIVCDFCGSFTDIDFAVGMDAWNTDPKRTETYQNNKFKYESRLEQLQKKGDKENYEKAQYDYWDFYYKIYPEYLPPNIGDGEKYKKYLEVCAHSSMDYAFNQEWTKKTEAQAKLQQAIKYYIKDGKTLIETNSFFKLADFFTGYIKDSFREFYDNPDYAIMHELLPPDVHLKMKLSMFVQAWIPYLSEADQQKLISGLHFSNEYVESPLIETHGAHCEFCKADINVPKGSYKVYCESCRKINKVKTEFNCVSCGSVNMAPENPAHPVNCKNCGTENRLIEGWF